MKKGGCEIAYTEFTLWLIPCEPLRRTLHALICRLAADLDAVEFEPHVTLFCGPSNEFAGSGDCRCDLGPVPSNRA